MRTYEDTFKGSIVRFKGAGKWFFFASMIKAAKENLEIGQDYIVTEVIVASSWTGVKLNGNDQIYSLSWFE
jgi:hypothetical protein